MLEVYRVKDTETGLYYNKRGWTKRGHIFTAKGHIKLSLDTRKRSIFLARYKDVYPRSYNRDWLRYKYTNQTLHESYLKEYEQEQENLKNVKYWFPDTWIITDTHDNFVCKVNDLWL